MIARFDRVDVVLDKSHILTELDWALPKGEIIGLLGKNGAGKSTLIRTLLGLILPRAGQVHCLGKIARDMGDTEKNKLAYVPQVAIGYEGLTVKRALKLHSSCYSQWNQHLVDRMLLRFDIALSKKIETLSIGQRQALMLVFALASKPEFLVMDEPIASLDPSARREVLQFIAEAANPDCTILYSTHITADINRLSDRVAMLADGKIQWFRHSEEMSQSVIIKGKLPITLKENALFQSRLLQKDEQNAIVCDWQTEFERELGSDTFLQTLNLEELFVQWHQLKDRKQASQGIKK